jgi:mannosyl-oligosaccharide alpha-1,2-mannosidase
MGLEKVGVGESTLLSFADTFRYTAGASQTAPYRMLVSELGSLSLEFTRLSQLTKNPKYFDAIQRINNELEIGQNTTQLPGMWPVSIDAAKPSFDQDNFFSLGGMSDSLYEYLPKQFLILGGLLNQPRVLYESFISVAKEKMFFRMYNPQNENLTVSGDIRVNNGHVQLFPRNQHLTCFTGGMVGIASRIFDRPQDLSVAEELTKACVWAYDNSVNGVAPEIFTVLPCPKDYDCTWQDKIWYDKLNINEPAGDGKSEKEVEKHVQQILSERRLPKGFVNIDDRRYILRPEAIESVFIMYRITGKQEYQEAAWRMFQAVEKVSRTAIAAAAIQDITAAPGKAADMNGNDGGIEDQKTDSMESFWLAETLKYFYLCFEEWDVVSLDEYVLNTEAHPLRRPVR